MQLDFEKLVKEHQGLLGWIIKYGSDYFNESLKELDKLIKEFKLANLEHFASIKDDENQFNEKCILLWDEVIFINEMVKMLLEDSLSFAMDYFPKLPIELLEQKANKSEQNNKYRDYVLNTLIKDLKSYLIENGKYPQYLELKLTWFSENIEKINLAKKRIIDYNNLLISLKK